MNHIILKYIEVNYCLKSSHLFLNLISWPLEMKMMAGIEFYIETHNVFFNIIILFV